MFNEICWNFWNFALKNVALFCIEYYIKKYLLNRVTYDYFLGTFLLFFFFFSWNFYYVIYVETYHQKKSPERSKYFFKLI